MAAPPQERDWELAKRINLSAARFEAVFDRARPQVDNLAAQIAFGALGGGNCASLEKIARAVAFARDAGWLGRLMFELVTGGEPAPNADALLTEIRRQGIQAGITMLEAMTDPVRGLQAAGLEMFHLPRILRQVCRIDINSEAKGTGFLVHPEFVITAYHVVRSLTEDAADPVGPKPAEERPIRAKPGTDKFIRVVFDDIDIMSGGHRTRQTGSVVRVAPDWLCDGSRCHDLELTGQFPASYDELKSKLDYVLIRLNGVARAGTPPVTIGTNPIAPSDRLTIYQHADGRSMALDRAEVTTLRGDWRFEHAVNTRPGSSGSPCFDRSFNVVALHQAGDDAKRVPNRGVPLKPVAPMIARLPLPTQRLIPMTELREGTPGSPVLGRSETQNWVWGELDAEQAGVSDRPILVLRGLPGSGKSFTYDLLRSLLQRTHHDVVLLRAAGDIQRFAPEEVASRLLDRLEYPSMSVRADEANTERPRWLSAIHLPALLAALDVGRKAGPVPKGVWIVIDDIDTGAIGSETEISAYLFGLYQAARTRPWLRFVLLGLNSDLNEELRSLMAAYDLTLPNEDDLRAYLMAKLPPELYSAPDLVVQMILDLVTDDLDVQPRSKHLGILQRKIGKAVQRWPRPTQ